MNEWQPMESAPKDGSDILVCSDDKAIVCAWWSDDFGEWRTYGVGGNQWIEPTHWMPLPDPPRHDKGAGE